jgi:DNA-binding YbaB/EbfC family protein
MDIMKMMKQAQGLQKKLKDTQDELAQTEITGESAGGAVKVICDGQGRFKSIKLTPQAINPENPSSIDTDTVEMLEDIISTAILQASKKATDEMELKMKSLTGGLNIPGMPGLF